MQWRLVTSDASLVTVLTPIRVAAPSCLTVWQQWHATGDLRQRDRLLFTLAPLVRHAGVDAQAGLTAVLVAVESFDPARHGSLERHAWCAVRSLAA